MKEVTELNIDKKLEILMSANEMFCNLMHYVDDLSCSRYVDILLVILIVNFNIRSRSWPIGENIFTLFGVSQIDFSFNDAYNDLCKVRFND